MSNREFAASAEFVAICEKAGVKPTVRQASKFRSGNGQSFGVVVAKAKRAHKRRPVPEHVFVVKPLVEEAVAA